MKILDMEPGDEFDMTRTEGLIHYIFISSELYGNYLHMHLIESYIIISKYKIPTNRPCKLIVCDINNVEFNYLNKMRMPFQANNVYNLYSDINAEYVGTLISKDHV